MAFSISIFTTFCYQSFAFSLFFLWQCFHKCLVVEDVYFSKRLHFKCHQSFSEKCKQESIFRLFLEISVRENYKKSVFK